MTAPIHHLRASLGERIEDARAAREDAPEPYRLRDAARDLALVSLGGCVAGMMLAFERLVRER